MNDIIHNFKRLEGETDEELIYRICSEKELIGSWNDVAAIINDITGNDFGESTYRKKYQSFLKLLKANQSKFIDTESQSKELQVQMREFERQKIKFRDERRAWNKQNYTDTRIDETLEFLKEILPTVGSQRFTVHDIPTISGDSDLLCCLADLHIGQTFDSYWGKYNTNIAKERLEKYLSEILRIGKLHNSDKIHVACIGDQISGFIHQTIQISNKENVIEQIKIATELISSFCHELTKHFSQVYFYNVSGNHSRLSPNKDNAVKDERLDDLIGWSVCNLLNHIENFHDLSFRKIDSTIGEAHIRGKNYLLIHGDMDSISKTGIGNLVTMLGFCPEYVVCGHKHTPAMNEFNGVTVYQSGSLPGSGDDHTIQNRLAGRPSQAVLVCDESGVQCCYNVKLN